MMIWARVAFFVSAGRLIRLDALRHQGEARRDCFPSQVVA
jgi:hypothetical protein